MGFIQLQIPDNAEVGDNLTFVLHGKELEIPVPEGSVAGDILQIQIDDGPPDGSDNNNEIKTTEEHDDKMQKLESSIGSDIVDNDSGRNHERSAVAAHDHDHDHASNDTKEASDDFKVLLHESLGITLEIHCSIKNDFLNEHEHKHEHDNHHTKEDKDIMDKKEDSSSGTPSTQHSSDGTFAMAWPAGIHLSKCISSPPFYEFTTNKKSVVELGSGLGLVGLSFMTTATYLLSHRKNEVKKIQLVLTDLPSALPIIRHNVTCNKDKMSSISSNGENITVEPLLWGCKSHVCSLAGDVDLILASDVLYNATMENYESLCSTITTLLKNKSTDKSEGEGEGEETKADISNSECEILLAVRWRKPEEERMFFQLMESKLGFQFDLILNGIDDKKYQCDLGWREFGNPTCAKSNEYFTNTFVKVQGQSIALKDITEIHMDSMTGDEYNDFEARFIQIYVGRIRDH